MSVKQAIPSIKFSDGNSIPQIGLGLWKVKDRDQFDDSFKAAIKYGYTHFDTAQVYGNEAFLGEEWHRAGLQRQNIFITTKIAAQHFARKKVQSSFAKSLVNLQTNYVDLLLLHFPVSVFRKGAWQEVEAIQAAGQANSIGVSNYTIRHLEEMERYAKVKPVVNQVELHLFLQQPELIQYCQQNNIVVEAYSPLAHGAVMDNQTIAGVAKKHGKTYAQIMLRWLVEHNLVVLPKSVTPKRVQENIDIFDFELDDLDKESLTELDRDMRTCWNPNLVP